MNKKRIVSALLFAIVVLAADLHLSATGLWINPSGEIVVPDSSLAGVTGVGLGGSLDFGVARLLSSGLSFDARIGFHAWVPQSTWIRSLDSLNFQLLAGWQFDIVPWLSVTPYAGGGANLILSAGFANQIEKDAGLVTNWVAGQLGIQAGVHTDFKMAPGLALRLDLAWRMMGEQGSVFQNFIAGLGIAVLAADLRTPSTAVEKLVTVAGEKETVFVKTVTKSPQDLAFDAMLKYETVNVLRNRNQTRIVLVDSFVANDAQFNARMDSQLPAIANYIKLIPDIKSIEVLAYVADDGVARNEISLSTARAVLVRDWMQENLKPDWQKIPAIGMGKANPVADNTNDEGRRKNRRLEIVLTLE